MILHRILLLALLGCLACAGQPPRHHAAQGALGPYSAAVEAGELVFLSGKVAPREGPFVLEAEACFDALEAELARLGIGTRDLVYVTVYLADMADFQTLNEVYARRVPAPHPARATLAVAALPARARLELAVVARAP